MLQRYNDFRKKQSNKDGVHGEKKSPLNEGSKKTPNITKTPVEDKEENHSRAFRFLNDRKKKPTTIKTSHTKEKIHSNPIEERGDSPNFPNNPSQNSGSPAINEGFLSREFIEGWLGRPLNGANSPYGQNQFKQETTSSIPPRNDFKKEPIQEEPLKKEPVEKKATPKSPPKAPPNGAPKPDPIEEDEDDTDEWKWEGDYHEDSVAYKIFRDRVETFECRIHVEGSTLSNTRVRLLIESSEWNVYFNGSMGADGKCVIPLKKMTILSEGLKGSIMLEVAVEGTLFYPWKETFQVQTAKKVKVEILSGRPQKSAGPSVRVSGI